MNLIREWVDVPAQEYLEGRPGRRLIPLVACRYFLWNRIQLHAYKFQKALVANHPLFFKFGEGVDMSWVACEELKLMSVKYKLAHPWAAKINLSFTI